MTAHAREWLQDHTEAVHYLALGAIVFAASWLRLTALRRQSLWFDEIDIVVRAQRPFSVVLRTFTTAGENGPLYNLLLATWVRIAGISEVAVRFPSAIAGTLTVPLIYVLARRLAGPTQGLLAAGLLAISPYHIWYSQEAKMYALLVLLATASTLLFVEALDRNATTWWIAYVGVTSIMFYTHVASVLVFVAQVGYALLDARSWRGRERAFLCSAAALTLPYLPIALWAVRVIGGGVATWQPDVSLWHALRIVMVKFSVNRYDAVVERRAALLFVALAVIGLCALARPLKGPRWGLLLAFGWLVPIAGLWAVSLRQSVFSDRYAIVALPSFVCLGACGLAWLAASRRLWPLGMAALYLLVAFSWGPIRDVNRAASAEKEDWRSAWADVAARAEPGDAIIVHPGYLITTRDYFVQREPRLAAYPVATIPSFGVGWLTDELMIQMVHDQIGESRRIWLIQSPDRVPADDPDHRLESWLAGGGVVTYEHEVTGVRVTLYEMPAARGQPARARM